eukprot:jgi/Tetstr1/434840/TSEL_002555.t1
MTPHLADLIPANEDDQGKHANSLASHTSHRWSAMVYKIGDQMRQRLQDFGPQAIANTMLAQSKMNCYNAALFNAAPARIMQLLPRLTSSLSAALELLPFHSQTRQLVLHGELRDAAASAWKSSSEKARPSQLQLDVLRVLQDMQLRCVSEWRTPGSGLSVDILVEADGNRQLHPTAVEVDGPSHFTCNSPVRETGSTVVKRRLLRGHWPEGRVVHVPYFVWDQLQDDLAKTGYLTHLLLDRQ